MQIIKINQYDAVTNSYVRITIKGELVSIEQERSLQGKINEAIWSNLWPNLAKDARFAPMEIVDALEKGGLKIVDK
jgi:hypothetical protein